MKAEDILFRGKRIDNGEWVEGSFVKTLYNRFIIPMNDETVMAMDIISVIPETVGQFTGLTDKNGVQIFGDDLRKGKFYDKDVIFRIYQMSGGFIIKAPSWASNLGNLNYYDHLVVVSLSDAQTSDWICNSTIHVGNIHTNP